MSQNAEFKKADLDKKNAKSSVVVESPKTTQENEKKEATQEVKNKASEEIKRILNPSAEQRLKSLEHFKILGDKFNFLKNKEDELNRFILSSDGTKEKISLSNSNGFNFSVTNSQTIEKVIELIQNDLKEFTRKAEEEVLNFTI